MIRSRSSDRSWRHSIEGLGFAFLPGVLGADEVTTLLNNVSGLDQRRSRAGIRHILRNPTVKAIANDARLLGIAQHILGEGAFPFRATLFDKSPEANWLITWHQDTALPLTQKHETSGWGPWSVKEAVIYAHAPAAALEQVLALRLHLDDCTPDNGPLRVLPGTHRLGAPSDDEMQRKVADERAVECHIPRGGLLAMRPLLIHASSKSTSFGSRRVSHIEYAAGVEVGQGLRLAVA